MFLNLTPHAITVIGDGETKTTFPPSGTVARVAQTSTVIGHADGLPLYRTTFGSAEGLPAEQEGTILIVSALVRAAVPGRLDVASPGELVRGSDGQPVGCRGLITNR